MRFKTHSISIGHAIMIVISIILAFGFGFGSTSAFKATDVVSAWIKSQSNTSCMGVQLQDIGGKYGKSKDKGLEK